MYYSCAYLVHVPELAEVRRTTGVQQDAGASVVEVAT
jgi:hypothetical protein